jgi:phospholipase/carboxylesterase
MSDGHRISRREFVVSAVAGSVLLACHPAAAAVQEAGDPARLQVRPSQPTERAEPGVHPLGLSGDRDGFLYVPPTYTPNRPAPLLVLMHGAGQSATEWSRAPLDQVFGSRRIVVVAPESRGTTWDFVRGGFGPDVRFIDKALGVAFRKCAIDPSKMALGGFSDGASYALSLGVTNGDFFSALMAFSPGYFSPSLPHGRPRIFISHGTSDQILNIDRASRVIVPRLKQQGYDVKYVEFDGRHTFTPAILNQAAEWFVG